MVSVSLTLSVPKRVWIGELSREFPEATFRVRSAQSCDGVGVGFVEVLASDPDRVLDRMHEYGAVHEVEVFQRGTDRALIQFETDEPLLLRVLDRTGVPVEMPFEIRDGEVDWELTTTRNRLSSLADELDQSEVRFIVEHVWDSPRFDRVLTDRQSEVVETAIDLGYYDSPRGCTQGELADELDLAKSTCCEILHRAEERIVKEFEGGDRPAFTKPAPAP
ncbi:helix-turn-helix domain-containing protein [Halopenitus persicus]|uniref:helix-turn-helix domain-containing protein n=1 Tax=Halopenitus persicus TaxID=1048396 RepID=UPI000BBA57AD|nr:helix-turn-helix domain-containing protein [Halopenitus persicus]